MNQLWVYMCPPSWTPSHLSPHPIPQGCPGAITISFVTLSEVWEGYASSFILFPQDCFGNSGSFLFSHSVMFDSFQVFVAAAAAKSLQSCPTLCDPIDGSPPGSSVHGILQARTLEWVAISSSNAWKWKVKVKSLSCVWLLATPWTAAYQAPPSMGFSRQEYWSGVPLPSPYFHINFRIICSFFVCVCSNKTLFIDTEIWLFVLILWKISQVIW